MSSLRRSAAVALLVLLTLGPVAAPVAAQVPTTINYQGRLLQNTADQDAVGGTVDVVFSIWSGPASDASAVQLWSESWTGIALSNGIFSVLLGSNGSPIDPADFQGDPTLFLQLEVDGETLLPRQQLGSAPFALVDEPANELQDPVLDGNQLGLTGSAATVDLAPYLDDTDQQDLALSGTVLSLTNDPTAVDLSGFLDNTDAQTLSLTGDTVTISGSGSSVDLTNATTINDFLTLRRALDAPRVVFVSSQTYDGDLGGLAGADAACQSLADAAGLPGTFLAWLGDGTDGPSNRFDRFGSFELVNGTVVADDWEDLTDGTLQNAVRRTEVDTLATATPWTAVAADGTPSGGDDCGGWTSNGAGDGGTGDSTATGSTWTAGGTGACGTPAPLFCFQQSSVVNTDNQVLALNGTDLELTSDDGTDVVNLASFLDGVDNQVLSLVGNDLRLTSDDGTDSVNLASFLDGVDNQELSLLGNDLRLTSDDGTDVVSLAAYLDNTDTQDLGLSGNTLSLTNSPSVSLAAFLDNTDSQNLSLSGSTLSLTGDATPVDLSGFLDDTDDQTLGLSGNTLSISGGNSVSLAPYLDNTDTQDLGLSGTTLSLTNSPSVNLAAFLDNTDNQGIASVLTNGTDAGDRDITNLDDVDVDQLTVQNSFECDADSAACIESEHIEQDAILGNDITDNVYILHIDCNGSCADMSMRDACNVIENLRGLSTEVELIGVSCIHDIPSTSGNGFVECDDGTEIHGDNECRAFNLRTLGDIPCINGDGTDAIVTCLETDIPK